MPDRVLLDTFPAFLAYWETAADQPVSRQLEGWAGDYLSPWPALRQMQIDDYAEEGIAWQQIAAERVFHHLAERLPAMKRAHQVLRQHCDPTWEQAQAVLGFEEPVIFVIHVGIGCGAGWATRYEGRSAVLFGLENIAEEGWIEPAAIRGLIAHELGHLAHFQRRATQGLADGRGPWWQLYTEGFAQWCEGVILGGDSWHMAGGAGWLAWCREHRGWLAAEFLRRADAGESMRPFFGSWYDLQGMKQTGYFLGHALVAALRAQYDLEQIASLERLEEALRPLLEEMT